MECRDIQKRIRAGNTLDDPGVRAHVGSCTACATLVVGAESFVRALDAADVTPSEADTPSFDVLASRIERERGPLAWLASRPTALRMLLALAGVAVLTTLVALAAPRADLAVYPLGRMLGLLLALGAVAAAVVVVALRPLFLPQLPAKLEPALLALALTAPFLVGVLPMAHMAHPASLEGTGADFLRRAAACFVFGAVVGAPILVLARFLDRRRHARIATALLAAAVGGLTGNLALQLHCPITDPSHILVGHGTVGMGLALVYGGLAVVFARRM